MVQFEQAPNAPSRPHPYPRLRVALDYAPLLIFLIAYFFGDKLATAVPAIQALGDPAKPDSLSLYIATAATGIATLISLVVSLIVIKRIPVMLLVTGLTIFILGGLTFVLKNESFIKMKPTIVNLIFALILLGGLFFKKSLVSYVFGPLLPLTQEGWRKLTYRFGFFFLCLAILNEIVWRTFSEEFWVLFKFPGIWILNIVFTLTQLPLLMREQIQPTEDTKTKVQ